MWEPWNGYDATKTILETGVNVPALVCLAARVAFGAHQALTETGATVPDDVSIASFDDDELASYMRPGLTTARLPYEQIGRRAMTQLMDPNAAPGSQFIEMPIQVRQSITAPRF
jgi:LacI family transcriptional regulator